VCVCVCVCACVCERKREREWVSVCICTGMRALGTGWRRLIGSPKLQIIFHKRATKYRSLLRKMTYKDEGSYESSPPCIRLISRWCRYIMCVCVHVCEHVCVCVCVCVRVCAYDTLDSAVRAHQQRRKQRSNPCNKTKLKTLLLHDKHLDKNT